MAAGKKVFISYSHKQSQWVWERLVPVLRAAGCADVFIDKERFLAGHGVKGQMDTIQDQAEVNLLVMSPDYLDSDYCRHEMDRAIASDFGFTNGRVLPLKREDCDLSFFQHASDPPLWVDLTNDNVADSWTLILKSLNAHGLNTHAPHWLDVRDEVVRKLRDGQSVNLVVRGKVNWRALRDEIKSAWLPRLALLDLDAPGVNTQEGLIAGILRACGCPGNVPTGARSVAALNALCGCPQPHLLAITHFESIRDRRKAYGDDLFKALRYLITDERALVLLAESRTPAKDVLPGTGEDSSLAALLHLVELRAAKV